MALRSRQVPGSFVVSPCERATLRINADLTSARTASATSSNRGPLRSRAALAALRADDEQRARITEALNLIRTAESWLEDNVTADLDFHRCAAAASGNPYIATVAGFLAGQMRQSIMFMRHNRNRFASNLMALNITEHSAIHVALVKRDPRVRRSPSRAHHRRGERLGYGLSPTPSR